MSAILGTAVTGAGGGAYSVNNSLRFRSSASAYLNRTPGVSGNRQKFTWSGWVKRGTVASGDYRILFGAWNGGSADWDYFDISFGPGSSGYGNLQVTGYFSNVRTTASFRDPSAWYHVVVAVDTTQATAANRYKMYINGSQITSFESANYPPQNQNLVVNQSSVPQYIGASGFSSSQNFDGYMAEVNFVDGQQLDASSFGATNASTGVWQPKAYSGTYGTNGFYQKYSDIATTTASNAGLGKDSSGNGNYFVTNNISVTAGVTYDAMKDSPTPASSTVGNFAVMNPVDKTSALNIVDGNLKTVATSGWCGARATFGLPTSGKYYWEATCISRSTGATVGILSTSAVITGDLGAAATGYIYNSGDGQKYNNGVNSAYGATWGTNDIIGITWDASTGTLAFYKNNVSQGNAWTGLTGSYSFAIGVNGSDSMAANFGQRPFTYTPPSGYIALQSYNLPTPTIGTSSTTLANKYFDATLYTGTGATQSITNAGSFQPDFVWIKDRVRGSDHLLVDAVRGVTSGMKSNGTIAQRTDTFFMSFNSNGFSLPANTLTDYWYTNISGDNEVAWQWKANGTGSSNTSGTITSTVSANTTSGFSVVTYTGTGVAGSIGHGLGTTPSFIIVKSRSNALAWVCYQSTLGTGKVMILNGTNGVQSLSGYWDSSPTSTVVNIGSNGDVNTNGATYVMYCFAPITGFSKITSYTGNGAADGPFVYCGFRPRFLMIKRTDTTANWILQDTARSTYNQTASSLYPNLSNVDDTSYPIDILSNGFKLRDTALGYNASGGNYIVLAFAESPFNYSLAR